MYSGTCIKQVSSIGFHSYTTPVPMAKLKSHCLKTGVCLIGVRFKLFFFIGSAKLANINTWCLYNVALTSMQHCCIDVSAMFYKRHDARWERTVFCACP